MLKQIGPVDEEVETFKSGLLSMARKFYEERSYGVPWGAYALAQLEISRDRDFWQKVVELFLRETPMRVALSEIGIDFSNPQIAISSVDMLFNISFAISFPPALHGPLAGRRPTVTVTKPFTLNDPYRARQFHEEIMKGSTKLWFDDVSQVFLDTMSRGELDEVLSFYNKDAMTSWLRRISTTLTPSPTIFVV